MYFLTQARIIGGHQVQATRSRVLSLWNSGKMHSEVPVKEFVLFELKAMSAAVYLSFLDWYSSSAHSYMIVNIKADITLGLYSLMMST